MDMKTVDEPKFERMLTVADIRKYLSVTNETVYNWIKKTDIPAHRVGKRWMFDKAELDAWIKSGKGAQ
jgi:excisionase family DNA binding protein